MCESYASISRGTLYNSTARTKEASLFSIQDYVERSTIFDAATWILEFRLSEYFTAGFLRQARKADEGCVADCCGNLECQSCQNLGENVKALDYLRDIPPTKPLTWPWAFDTLMP